MAFSGTYRGLIRFRSLLELSVIRLLEEDGLILGSTMLYEATRIPYGRKRKRTYVVDLTFPQTKALIEVKPSSRVNGRRNVTKRLAAEAWAIEHGWTYEIMTERHVRERGVLLTLRDIPSIPEVILDGRSQRRLVSMKRKRKGKSSR